MELYTAQELSLSLSLSLISPILYFLPGALFELTLLERFAVDHEGVVVPDLEGLLGVHDGAAVGLLLQKKLPLKINLNS